MIRYVGLDVHKRFIEVCILDSRGKVVFRGKTSCEREELQRFAVSTLKPKDRVALESTTNTWPVVEILRPFVAQVVVGNPLKTKAIAEAKVKTDKVDAEVLAQLLRCEYLPAVWQPDEQTRQWRSWITHRTALMTNRARIKNRVQGLLGRLLIHSPYKLLWTKNGIAWLRSVELPPHERLVLDSELRQLAACQQELTLLDVELAAVAQREPRVQLLMTMPGINYVVALAILGALGDIHRFQDGDHAAAYLGLAPSTRQSGRRCYHGHITKAGNSQARWLLTQSAQHASRHAGPIGAFFRRLVKRKKRNVAITAVARKLVTIAYLMLKNNEPYRYAHPELMRKKFIKVKILNRGSGGRQLSAKGLAEMYQAAGLPEVKQPEQLPPGEQRMLSAQSLGQFAKELYRPTRSPNGKKPSSPRTQSSPKAGRPVGRPR